MTSIDLFVPRFAKDFSDKSSAKCLSIYAIALINQNLIVILHSTEAFPLRS
jgi:hypothetical protein